LDDAETRMTETGYNSLLGSSRLSEYFAANVSKKCKTNAENLLKN